MLREMDRRITAGNPVGWDFSKVPDMFVGSSADLRQLWETLDGWGDVVDVEAEKLGGDERSVVEVPAEPLS